MEDSLRRRAEKRLGMLKNERSSWEPGWRELSEYIQPMRSRFLLERTNKGDRRSNKIINNEATEDAVTMAAGIMSGLTPRSRPWFNMVVKQKELMEFGPVKNWLYEVAERIRDALLRSNFYNCMHDADLELGVFGTGALWIDEDKKSVLTCESFTTGEYYVAMGVDGRVNSFYREFSMTAAQLEEKFGKDKLSDAAKTALEQSRHDQRFDCVQMVQPNDEHDPARRGNKHLPFVGLTWEQASPPEKVLEHTGFHEFPVVVIRWSALPGDSYGTGPGRNCIGDIKALQLYERAAARLVEAIANPPLQAPTALRGQPSSSNPGSITYVDQVGGQNQISPIYQPNPSALAGIQALKQECEQRIRRSFYVDLFLMISQMDDVRTATEIAARKEEKMAMLGPVVERMDYEGLDRVIDRVFGIMLRQSMPIWAGVIEDEPWLPVPPEELGDTEVEADYISVLAQAQKAQAVTSLERYAQFVGGLAAAFPESADKMNADQLVDEYAEAIGVVPTVVRGDDEVDAIRQQRAQQAQAAQAQQAIANGIQGAKTLSETQLTPDSALGRIIGA
jgi:hypothetical protein